MATNLKNLDFKTAGFWPEPMKIAAYVIAFAAILLISWFLLFSSKISELRSLEQKEQELQTTYEQTQTKANNLPELRQELDQINDLLKTLITRLPNKNEIPELVVDVSQAALANGLRVDLFEPQEESKQDFYAEKRINVKFRGDYHQLGAFFSEVAQQPRLIAVVVQDMAVAVGDPTNPSETGATTQLVATSNTPLFFTGTVRTYRYLSDEEEAEVAQAKLEAEKAASRQQSRGRAAAANANAE